MIAFANNQGFRPWEGGRGVFYDIRGAQECCSIHHTRERFLIYVPYGSLVETCLRIGLEYKLNPTRCVNREPDF